jgi:hypothetical protein
MSSAKSPCPFNTKLKKLYLELAPTHTPQKLANNRRGEATRSKVE